MKSKDQNSTFCDETKVRFLAGKGGDGSVSFRREKFIPKGGPDGGDGGSGGSIILVADNNINTLSEFNTSKYYKAENGVGGKGQNQHGKNGENLTLKVPVGTTLKDSKGQVIYDLDANGVEVVVAKGGKGGRGNDRFKSSIHQTPTFAEKGEPGEDHEISLELKLVGDVGIIGLPSAGKSTFLSVVSNARPKIADYHFTTLIPNLGIVDMAKYIGEKGHSFVAADIPGLIEEAHKGKGLGHKFLRHILRTKILVHVIDGNSDDLYRDYQVITKELAAFDKALSKKHEVIIINKIDLLSEEKIEEIKKIFKKHKKEVQFISAVSQTGLKDVMIKVWQTLAAEKKADKEIEIAKSLEPIVLTPQASATSFSVTKVKKNLFRIESEKVERMVKMTDLNHKFGVLRIYRYFKARGIEKALIKEGALEGDNILVGKFQLPFHKHL